MKHFYHALFFLSLFVGGVHLGKSSWDGVVYVYLGERRAPASLRKPADYVPISNQTFTMSSAQQLMEFAQIFKQEGVVGLRLGHPLIPHAQGGGLELACEAEGRAGSFTHMEVQFWGTGASSHGDKPTLTVNLPCRVSSDIAALEILWIPMKFIVSQPVQDMELQNPLGSPGVFRLENMPDVWPENWLLWSVRFYREDDSDATFEIDAAEMRETSHGLISFDWAL